VAFTGTKKLSVDKNAVNSTFAILTITGMDDNVTLTEEEAKAVGMIVATPTANDKAVIFPSAIPGKVVFVVNKASATNSVIIKVGASGTGAEIEANKKAIVACAEDDFVAITADK